MINLIRSGIRFSICIFFTISYFSDIEEEEFIVASVLSLDTLKNTTTLG